MDKERKPLPDYAKEMIKTGVLTAAGLAFAVQPWLSIARVLGIIAAALGALVLLATWAKVRKAKKMLSEAPIRFASGDCVLPGGLFAGGEFINFDTFGTDATGASLRDGQLQVAYRFAVKGRKRRKELAVIPYSPEEEALAQEALALLDLPEIPEDYTCETVRYEPPKPVKREDAARIEETPVQSGEDRDGKKSDDDA